MEITAGLMVDKPASTYKEGDNMAHLLGTWPFAPVKSRQRRQYYCISPRDVLNKYICMHAPNKGAQFMRELR